MGFGHTDLGVSLPRLNGELVKHAERPASPAGAPRQREALLAGGRAGVPAKRGARERAEMDYSPARAAASSPSISARISTRRSGVVASNRGGGGTVGAGGVTDILLPATKTRHVRLEQHGRSNGKFWSIHRLEVYGQSHPK